MDAITTITSKQFDFFWRMSAQLSFVRFAAVAQLGLWGYYSCVSAPVRACATLRSQVMCTSTRAKSLTNQLLAFCTYLFTYLQPINAIFWLAVFLIVLRQTQHVRSHNVIRCICVRWPHSPTSSSSSSLASSPLVEVTSPRIVPGAYAHECVQLKHANLTPTGPQTVTSSGVPQFFWCEIGTAHSRGIIVGQCVTLCDRDNRTDWLTKMRVSTEVATKFPLTSVTSESDNRTQTEPTIITNDDAFWSQGWRNGVAISGENDSVSVVGHDPAMFHFHGEFLLFLTLLDFYVLLDCDSTRRFPVARRQIQWEHKD